MRRPHIVILGAGFGGTYVAKQLVSRVKNGEIDVTIVNKTNYFLFTPLLHEVATGSLSPRNVAEPIREIFVNTGVELCQGAIQSIDRVNHRVQVATSVGHVTLPYDYLVIATGSETNYYDISGAEKHTLALKDLSAAIRIRSRIIDSFEEAIITEDPEERKRLLTFVVIGGGPTGVETAGELAEFVQGMAKRYYSTCTVEETRVILIHRGEEILDSFPQELRQATEQQLRSKGVILHLKSTVAAVSSRGLTLEMQNEPLLAGTIIWTAGVKPNIPKFADGEEPQMISGRLAVNENFLINDPDKRIFALGDVAAYIENSIGPDQVSRPHPMLAQVAVKQANIVAVNIMASIAQKPLKAFHFQLSGLLVSVGQWFAVGQVFSKVISGRFTWWLWRTAYLFKFASWKKRLRIGFEWAVQLFTTRDITKLN